ncbi:uncharacterized protein N0V89_012004 [Didymosphaeria variabile]|uniref:Uncharacterized protein n=1 Tax=Didymosphaeria variabile TaxID=1932322 RepID=A0A9W8XB10_9PLEO|nr:uncharacterized protein N0V89_012004 [Didymosphaeria variabile]KAJ4345869.1 hypothetical protein N0V89_012004 [Didymosphaeria variabile]
MAQTHKLRKRMIELRQYIDIEQLEDLYLDWLRWREGYSRSSVTKVEDKLVAIQGIAQDVGSLFDDKLIVGMWKSRILQDLCFSFVPDTGVTMRPPLRKLAPSWSWASTNQRIWPVDMTRYNTQGTYLAKVISLDVSETAFRGSHWAMLWIQCNLIRMIPKWDVPRWDKPSISEAIRQKVRNGQMSVLRGFTMAKTGVYVEYRNIHNEGKTIDNIHVDPKDRSLDVYMLVIRQLPSTNWENRQAWDEIAEGLLLTRRPVPEHAFERIGFFEMEGDACRELLVEHKVSENQIIALV